MQYQGFVGSTYTLQAISAECQRTINLYPQVDETGEGKNRAILLSTPGLRKVKDMAGPPRDSYVASNDRFFIVVGANLLEVSSTYATLGTYALPGEAGNTSAVSMTDNGLALMIVTGPRGYFFDFTTLVVTQITDEVFLGADVCAFINGYFVFNEPNSQRFWITDLYSDVVDPLGFATAEGSPDRLITLLADHEELWLFGDTSTEVWYDSGDANFPFAKIQGAFISHGIAAALSAQRLDNTVFWLGNDDFGQGIVWRANGYAPVRCSTHAMEQTIQRYPTIADATSYTYQQDGHSFYVLNFPSGDATWVYDAATNLWHERAYLGTLALNDGQLHRGRPNTHSFAFGKHLVGDWEAGALYEMSPAYADDDVREVKRVRRAPYITNERKRVFFNQFELDMEVGQGSPDGGPTPDPQITLRFSDDGGYTWSNENTVSMGVSGAYKQRVIWRRLGGSRQRVFEVSTAQSGIFLRMFNAYLELSLGNS